jgi:ERCC4-type nuclease
VRFTDYLLDFIVERKTADDLAASIMDGRYEE